MADNKKVLIIGGMGYIGSTLLDVISKKSTNTCTILDTLEFNINKDFFHKILTEPEKVKFIKDDVANFRTTYDLIRSHDIIIYLVSLTLEATDKNPEEGILVNRHMAEIVGDYCNRLNKKMIFLSTCSNYGRSAENTTIDEDGKLLPISMYARTKVDTERYLLKNVKDIIICRCATAYGLGAGRTRYDTIFNSFVLDALKNGKIEIFEPDAHRPICHVYDLANMIYVLMNKKTNHKIYNLGFNDQNYTKHDMVKIISKHIDIKIDIVESNDDRDYAVSFDRLYNELKFKPIHTPDSAILEIIEQNKNDGDSKNE